MEVHERGRKTDRTQLLVPIVDQVLIPKISSAEEMFSLDLNERIYS